MKLRWIGHKSQLTTSSTGLLLQMALQALQLHFNVVPPLSFFSIMLSTKPNWKTLLEMLPFKDMPSFFIRCCFLVPRKSLLSRYKGWHPKHQQLREDPPLLPPLHLPSPQYLSSAKPSILASGVKGPSKTGQGAPVFPFACKTGIRHCDRPCCLPCPHPQIKSSVQIYCAIFSRGEEEQ